MRQSLRLCPLETFLYKSFDMHETIIIVFEYEGSYRKANVKEIEGEFESMFHVTLDDGYENIFLRAVDRPYQWYEQNIGYTELAQVIGRSIEISFFT